MKTNVLSFLKHAPFVKYRVSCHIGKSMFTEISYTPYYNHYVCVTDRNRVNILNIHCSFSEILNSFLSKNKTGNCLN